MAFSGILPTASLLANRANRDRESTLSERRRVSNMVDAAMERKERHEAAQQARHDAKVARNWRLGLAAGGAALGAVGGGVLAGLPAALPAGVAGPLAAATFSGTGALVGAGVGAAALGGLAGENPGQAIAQGAAGFADIYEGRNDPTGIEIEDAFRSWFKANRKQAGGTQLRLPAPDVAGDILGPLSSESEEY